MAEEALSDALLNALSKEMDIALYPVGDFAVDLGLRSADASAAEQHSFQTLNPQGKYEYLLKKFVDTHGRDAKNLIDIFKDKQKMVLVNFLEEAIKNPSHLRKPEPGPANSRNQWRFVAGVGLSLVVVLLAIVVACNIFPEPEKCSSSPCQNGGTCHELKGAYSCECNTGYGGSDCETEYISETFSLEEFQDALRIHYETNLFRIPLEPWDPDVDVDLKKIFTTISLYKEDNNNIPVKPLHKSTINGSVNDIFQTKVRVVLFGEAGRGKTTAVAKMAYDWANQTEDSPWKNVKLLFVFKMRNMNAKTGITEAIVPLLGKKYQNYLNELEHYIDSHEKDIVMLFDGYDEFSGELDCEGDVGGVIDILCLKICRQCRVLVTSRPVRKGDFINSREVYYSKMVIEGYSQQHATDFIAKFFRYNETKGAELTKYLEEDIVTNEMTATPLFCTMVCYLWNDGFINGNYTRTKLFDDIMEFMRRHLNAKDERDREITRDLLKDTVVSVGQVAYTKLRDNNDPNSFLLSEDDFSDVLEDRVNISFSLGLLTRKTDSDIEISIKFFHKFAHEYSAGRYLASRLDKGIFSTIGFSQIFFDLKEIFQFASGTSVLACRQILASFFEVYWLPSDNKCCPYVYQHIVLDLISEAETCAEGSETYLTRFFIDGKIRLPQVTASTVIGLENLPGSVKEKITSIDIHEANDSPDLFVRLWNSMNTSSLLTHLVLPIPSDIRFNLKYLTSVRIFETERVRSVSSLAHVLTFLPKIRELVIEEIELEQELENTKAFCELWKNLHTSPDLNRIRIPIPSSRNIPCDLEQLRSVQVLKTQSSSLNLPSILFSLPNLQKLHLETDITSIDIHDANVSPDLFVRLWNSVNTSSLLTHLVLPIPSDIRFNLKHLTSVRIFEASQVISIRSLAHVLTFLPKVKELIIQDIEQVELDYNTNAFCELWKNLHTSPDLSRLLLPIPSSRNIPCDLKQLRSVQVFETQSYSLNLPILLIKVPNLQELMLHFDIHITEYSEMDAESAQKFVIDLWSVLSFRRELHHLEMNVPEFVPALPLKLKPLLSVQTFKTKIDNFIDVFPILLFRLPNISELDIFAENNYVMIAEETYYDEVVSAIIDGLVKHDVQLTVLNMKFNPDYGGSETVSRDTVENFIQMLKKSGMMLQLEIISLDYCVFKESDLIEIITAIRECTSINVLRIDCSLDSEGELFRFAIQRDQPQDENQEPNQSDHSGSLMLTLFYTDPETNLMTEGNFVLPRSQ